MSDDTLIEVRYGYVHIHRWTERRGDTVYFMSRCDEHNLDGTLKRRGESSCGDYVMKLNGWEPPASALRDTSGKGERPASRLSPASE